MGPAAYILKVCKVFLSRQNMLARFNIRKYYVTRRDAYILWIGLCRADGMYGCGKAGTGMRIRRLGLRPTGLPVVPIFCAGLVVGILIMGMGKSVLLENTGLFDEYTLYNMKYMTVDSNALFSYVFRERILKLLALAVLSTTYLGLAACAGTAAWYGMSAGVYLAALTIRYGVKGIFLAAVSLFPQYILYIPVLLALLTWCVTLYRGIYHHSIDFEEDKAFLPKALAKLAAILLAATAGCLLEAYVNPYFLVGYLKVF